ncbi:hypothetical protein BU17DRAFT_61849 [Hysterangium stoloniferum]|nr:hypothetical protein BU17DRAFT_61849 [Hysterangium stoloniferum]
MSSPNTGMTNAAYAETFVLIAQVVKRMKLRRFCWGSEPIKSLKFVFQAVAESSPDLQELDLIYNPSEETAGAGMPSDSDFGAPSDVDMEETSDMNDILSPLPQFHNLTKVSLQLFDYNEEKVPYTSSIQDMLIACSNLVDICLVFSHSDMAELFDISSIFEAAEWPMLRRLTIKGDVDALARASQYREEEEGQREDGSGNNNTPEGRVPPYGSLLASFLANHPSLECFWLDLLDGNTFYIEPHTLPRLHSLKLSSGSGGTISLLREAIPADVAPHIQFIDSPNDNFTCCHMSHVVECCTTIRKGCAAFGAA